MLEVKNLNVYRKKRMIVKNVSFTVEKGDWLMVAGPNGCGKSTLLNGIMGLLKTEGDVYIDGYDLKKLKDILRTKKIGMMFQNNIANQDFSVEEIVTLGRYGYFTGIFRQKTESDIEAVHKALKDTGLYDLREKSIMQLSGGEKQRVFLAQIIAQNPEIMILDEPTNNLDLRFQKEILDFVEKWHKEKKRTVISVVHDLSLVRKYGNKILIMKDGRCIEQGDMVKKMIPEVLNSVYDMNVKEWMQELLEQWN